jgi:hypothetical protein
LLIRIESRYRLLMQRKLLLTTTPSHLREVCDILARGFLRLRHRNAETATATGAHSTTARDCSLHFSPDQSGHANPTNRRVA